MENDKDDQIRELAEACHTQVNKLLQSYLYIPSNNIFKATNLIAGTESWLRGYSRNENPGAVFSSSFDPHVKNLILIRDIVSEEISKMIEAKDRLEEELISVDDIINEFKAIEQEFGNIEINLSEKSLSVETKRITLVHKDEANEFSVELGPYTIKYYLLRERGRPRVYHPETPCKIGYPHPHVNESGAPCMGDHEKEFYLALNQFRLFDVFDLLNTMLHNYDPHGAYVNLYHFTSEVTQPIRCANCGRTKNREKVWTSNCCGFQYCDDCQWTCPCCNKVECGYCSKNVIVSIDPRKTDRFCNNCSHRCIKCKYYFPQGLFEKGGKCPTCLQLEEKAKSTDSLHTVLI